MKSSRNFLMLAALLSIAPSLAKASEVDLACQAETLVQSREVIFGTSRQVKALQETSTSAKKVFLKKYAVVIEFSSSGGQTFRVLAEKKFSIEQLSDVEVKGDTWRFVDKSGSRDVVYICSPNGEVHANPAISRGN